MSQVYGAGGKTMPKAGRLGSGAYHPSGTPIYVHKGNTFPGIHPERPEFPQLSFGDPSRAGVASVVGQNRVQSISMHPNQSQYNNATIPLCPAMLVGSSNDDTNLQPVSPKKVSLVMPHERNTNSANGTKKKPNTFRTAFGASKTMPTDTAFVHNPGANYKHSVRQRPNSAVEGVKKVADERSFAHVHNPLSVSGGVKHQHRTPPASFVSRGNHWTDPSQSFIAGRTNVRGVAGAGRWSVVKRGVV